jgi:hypothetical protein
MLGETVGKRHLRPAVSGSSGHADDGDSQTIDVHSVAPFTCLLLSKIQTVTSRNFPFSLPLPGGSGSPSAVGSGAARSSTRNEEARDFFSFFLCRSCPCQEARSRPTEEGTMRFTASAIGHLRIHFHITHPLSLPAHTRTVFLEVCGKRLSPRLTTLSRGFTPRAVRSRATAWPKIWQIRPSLRSSISPISLSVSSSW